MQDADDLKRLGVGAVDDQLRVDRPEAQFLIDQVVTVVARARLLYLAIQKLSAPRLFQPLRDDAADMRQGSVTLSLIYFQQALRPAAP